jgi:hypothetical protein
MPNTSVRQLAKISHYSSSTVFCVLTFVLHLKFRHWKCIPHFLPDNDKKKWMLMTKSLEILLVKAQRRNWLNFWTRDESWIMWDNFPTGSGPPLDREILQKIRQTIGAKKLMLVVFCSPVRFPMRDMILQDITFTAECFVAQVLTPLHHHKMSLSQDTARRKLNLHFDNSQCHTIRSVTDEMVKLRCKRVAHPSYSLT